MKVDELFNVSYGHSIELNRQILSDEAVAVNFVSRTEKNNGVSARILPIEGLSPAAAGSLTVALGGSVLETFLQTKLFYTGYHISILTPRAPMSNTEKLWWAMCIRANKYRYDYGRQANKTLSALELPTAIPPWVTSSSLPNLEEFKAPDLTTGGPMSLKQLPPITHWGKWKLSDLFVIKKGTRLTKDAMIPGPNPYIGASEFRNGVTAHVGNPTEFPGHVITVPYNGSVGVACYQPSPFLAGDDVHVLIPKTTVTAQALLGVCAVIRIERYRFDYGRKWNLARMEESTIRLPKKDGAPDWALIDAYIRHLPYSNGVRPVPATLINA